MLSVLGCIGGVILSGTAATSTGYFVFTLLGAACLVAIADARRRLAQLSQDERADGLAIHPRDQTAFGRAREEACTFHRSGLRCDICLVGRSGFTNGAARAVHC
jgi:hypothetical protein